MPQNACCNPLRVHKAQYTKSLRQVTDATAYVSSLVTIGDYICDICRKKLTAWPKVVPSTSESLALEPPDLEPRNPEQQNPETPNPEPSNTEPSNPEPSNAEPPNPECSIQQDSPSAATSIDVHPLPSTSGIQNRDETIEVSTDESFMGGSADESAEESTAEEYSTEVDEEIAKPILNECLPTLGETPVKRSK